jgi:hypothetical protein
MNTNGGKVADAAEAFLERYGFMRDIAGDADFQNAVEAVSILAAHPEKWLIVTGMAGVGKTHLAKIVYGSVKRPKESIDCNDDAEVDWLVPESDRSLNGDTYSSTADSLFGKCIMLDDIGGESIRSSYGNVYDRVGRFIMRYYEKGRDRLIVTTNLNAAKLAERYGGRVMDRIADRAVILEMGGGSKRDRTILKAS